MTEQRSANRLCMASVSFIGTTHPRSKSANGAVNKLDPLYLPIWSNLFVVVFSFPHQPFCWLSLSFPFLRVSFIAPTPFKIVLRNYIIIYIDGLKLRMRIWKRHSTRAKLKNCILPAFRNLECVPPPRMKLFGNQQLECLQGHMFFPGRNTYIS